MAIDTCVENFSSTVLKALAASTAKSHSCDNPQLPISSGIQDEIHLKNQLRRQWQVSMNPALRAEVNRLQRSVTHWLNGWRNDQLSATLESLNPEDQTGDESSHSISPPWSTQGESLYQTLRKMKP
jgi:hypothetical protein